MVDFRENVFPVATSSLLFHKDDARCLHNALTVASHNKLFNIQKSSCLQDIISRTHSYLSTSKDRVTGLILLAELIEQCNTEVYQQHSSTWLRLLLQILQSHVPPSVYKATCHLIGLILQFSKQFTDLSREIVSMMIPQLIPLLLGASSEWRGSAVVCMTSCLQTYPGPMVTIKTKIEKLVLDEIEGDCCPKEAIECLCHLVQCGGGGNQGNKHSDSWTDLCDKLIASLQETLSALYDGLETETPSVHTDSVLQLKTIDSSHQDRLPLLVHRWTVLSGCLQTLLRTEFHAVARIPADVIIKLVCRCLSINRKMLLNRPTTERTSLALQLPSIHIAALKVFKQLILMCGALLVPWCRIIMGYISLELLWTHWPDTQGSDKPYGVLRSCVYEVLTVWLKVMDGSSGFVHEEKLIIKELLHDLTPEKEVLKIDQPVTTINMDGPPVKKKHKGGNYEVSQGISSQRKVHTMANARLVETGLEALYWIITTTGPELDRRCLQDIQEFSVRTLLLIQQYSLQPVPYGSLKCRKGLYKVLFACALCPHPTAPPFIHCAVGCLSAGLQDKNIEVSSFCLEASRTCEVLIHPRVPCLNGPIICENVVYLSDSSSDKTTVQGHSMLNNSDILDNQIINDNQSQVLNSSNLQTQEYSTSVNGGIRNFKTNGESFISDMGNRDNEKITNKGKETTKSSRDSSTGSESLPDLEDTSNKRVRNEFNDDGASKPKYAKTDETTITNDVNNPVNSGFIDKPIDIDESSSESVEEPIAKGTIIGTSTEVETTAGAMVEPQPSTSKEEAIEIMSEGDSSDVEEITDDVANSEPAVSNAQLIVTETAIEEVRTTVEKQTEDVNGTETKEDFITTDSQGNKEVLTAIPITELSSDDEESSLRELEQKSHATSENITDKDPDPEVAAMLMTFVDADPDPE